MSFHGGHRVGGVALSRLTPSATAAGSTQAYLQGITDLSTLKDLQWSAAISSNGAYSTGFIVGNWVADPGSSGTYFITMNQTTASGMVVGGKGGVFGYSGTGSTARSGNGGGPRIEASFAAQAKLGVSLPIRHSAMYTTWANNALKQLSLNQGASGQVIVAVLQSSGTHFVDLFTANTDYLHTFVGGTGLVAKTAIGAGVEYEILVRCEVSTGRIKWWVRNVDTSGAPILNGNYGGLSTSMGNFTNAYVISQMGGDAQNTCPTTFTDTRGRFRVRGTAA